jgi:predicted RNA-binding protein YlqC (UPF0109 family)
VLILPYEKVAQGVVFMPNAQSGSMKELIEFVAKTLVDQPDRVNINEIVGAQTNVLELKVAKEDVGKIIGKSGRTADAIRTILNCGAAKLNKRFILHIIDE